MLTRRSRYPEWRLCLRSEDTGQALKLVMQFAGLLDIGITDDAGRGCRRVVHGIRRAIQSTRQLRSEPIAHPYRRCGRAFAGFLDLRQTSEQLLDRNIRGLREIDAQIMPDSCNASEPSRALPRFSLKALSPRSGLASMRGELHESKQESLHMLCTKPRRISRFTDRTAAAT